MEHMCAVLHDPNIIGGGVSALTVGDRVDELVFELLQRPQEVRLHEV